ncbi:hypothetical protein A5653_07325 [Mycobacterium colombiense]|uniref:TIGR03621 family F420-dependent LLM class oxidoreductase n=1 Tax=Mycobacterium colombiense TaxID=339268 RepID=UPI0007F045F9|nr:TIGR03621 family F420-dependent LLM class oxidoreductase [Mycobacterium colombiense]OBK58582.1 hypothetical protein A5653_07325 [Mycobacterium colombiense]
MTLHQQRPIRFGIIASGPTAADLIETAQSAEQHGFSTVALNDHFSSTVAPLLGLQAMAAATSHIRVATAVLNQDLRHPAVLAKELATLDVLSGGRLELGLGAGWVRADYDQSGIAFDSAGERIERLAQNIDILRGLFAQRACTFAGKHFRITGLDGTPKPVQSGGPPIMIGGGGRKILTMAARRADIIQVVGQAFGTSGAIVDDLSSFRFDAFNQRVGWIADAAGDRFEDIELSLMLVFVAITDDVPRAGIKFLDFLSATVSRYGGEVGDIDVRLKTLIDSPVVAIGSVDQICDKLLTLRDALGVSYFIAPYGSTPADLAAIIEKLTRT